MQRQTPRSYTDSQKAEFFRRLAERPNVSAVAREMGFPRVTCYAWAHKAGIFTSQARKVNLRKEEFLRLRAAGFTRAEARARVGADARSATDWDKGITIIHRGRLYPDGRVVRYPEPKMAGMNPKRRSRAIGGSVDLDRVEKVIHPRYLSLVEREQLQDLRRTGLSIRQVAAELGRSPSTISRELRRNTASRRGYLPHTAHRLSVHLPARLRRPKLLANTALQAYVQAKLKKKWSPQQISNRLVKDFPTDIRMRVSTETIYQAIYVHARAELKSELGRHLRRGRSTRKPHKQPDQLRPRFVDPMAPISERPVEAHSRIIPGHWESQCCCQAAIGNARPGST